MNCEEARQILMDTLDGSMPAARDLMFDGHIASCDACRRFADFQRILDARLTAAVPGVSLSPEFRSSLRRKLKHHTDSAWPESLPDIAHVVGCVLAIVLLALFLPRYSRTILLAGSAFTAVTYFFQAMLRNAVASESD
jgi:anti-sigma factor RsiW